MVQSFHSKNIEQGSVQLLSSRCQRRVKNLSTKKEKSGKSLTKVARSKKQSSRSKSQSKQERYWDSNLEATNSGYTLWNVVEWTDMCRYYSQDLDLDLDLNLDLDCLNSYVYVCKDCHHIKYSKSNSKFDSDSDSDSDSESNYNEKYSYLLNRKSLDFDS